MTVEQTALVLGATGGIGGEVARLLMQRGSSVRALNRDPGKLSPAMRSSGLEWRQGDAMSATDVAAAADGASVIVHAVNPPATASGASLCCRCSTTPSPPRRPAARASFFRNGL